MDLEDAPAPTQWSQSGGGGAREMRYAGDTGPPAMVVHLGGGQEHHHLATPPGFPPVDDFLPLPPRPPRYDFDQAALQRPQVMGWHVRSLHEEPRHHPGHAQELLLDAPPGPLEHVSMDHGPLQYPMRHEMPADYGRVPMADPYQETPLTMMLANDPHLASERNRFDWSQPPPGLNVGPR